MSNELIEIAQTTAIEAFSTKGGLNPAIKQVKDYVGEFEHDLSTATGRKKTASLANNVAKLKVKLDGMGKELVSDWKEKAKLVDASRKFMRDELDSLKGEARLPLTEWEAGQERIKAEQLAAEEAEKLRVEIESCHEIALLMNEKLDREIEDALKIELERAQLQIELEENARIAYEEKLKIEAANAAKVQAEADAKAEIDRIKAEHQSKVDEAARVAREAAALAENKRLQELAEKERIERERLQAIAAQERAVREAEEAIEKERERVRIQKDRESAEVRAREDNKRHVGTVRRVAKEAIMGLGVDESTAKKIIIAINADKIPNVSLSY